MDAPSRLTRRFLKLARFSGPLRYATAVAAVVLTAALQGFLLEQPSIAPFVLSYLAVAVVASLGGPLPGLLTVALSAALVNREFIAPFRAWAVTPAALAATAMFVLSGSAIAVLCGFLRATLIALRDNQLDLNRAQAVAHVGSWRADFRTNELLWSDETYAMFGVPNGTRVTYETFLDIVHPEDRDFVRQSRQAALGGQPYDVEHRIVVGGRVRWVHERAALGIDRGRSSPGAFGTVQDVTEQREAQRALEEASRAKDHFLAVLSHELRTPLSPVLNGTALLEREVLSERARQLVQVIRRNVELEARLIDDLLDLTRITRGKVDLQRQEVELCTIIDRAVEVCRPDIEARRLHFRVDYGPRPYLLLADAARLQQVFWNLLKNAVKFTPHDGCVGIRCRPEDDLVVVEVHDSGVGIERSALGGIFDAFAQAERSIARQFGGLGLGLTISKSLTELHGGRIEAASEGLGKGATLRVWLPILSYGGGERGERGSRAAPAAAGRRCLRILLVEDHGDTAETMVAMLEIAGHQVRTAGDVTTALEAFGQQTFDVLISDLGLPDRSGLELMRELRGRGHALAGIAVSGYGLESDVEQSRAAGFDAHLVKPVDPWRLFEVLESVARSDAPRT